MQTRREAAEALFLWIFSRLEGRDARKKRAPLARPIRNIIGQMVRAEAKELPERPEEAL